MGDGKGGGDCGPGPNRNDYGSAPAPRTDAELAKRAGAAGDALRAALEQVEAVGDALRERLREAGKRADP